MKKILDILGQDWTGHMLAPLEFVGMWTAKIISAPFVLGARLMAKL